MSWRDLDEIDKTAIVAVLCVGGGPVVVMAVLIIRALLAG